LSNATQPSQSVSLIQVSQQLGDTQIGEGRISFAYQRVYAPALRQLRQRPSYYVAAAYD
jgi:hypothetical protein